MLGWLGRWYRESIFPEALHRAETIYGSIGAVIVSIGVEAAKSMFPSSLSLLAGVPAWLLGAATLALTLEWSLVAADAARLKRLQTELRQLRSAGLEIVHDRDCRWCSEDFVLGRILRIGLHNLGTETIDDVSVSVAFDPDVNRLMSQVMRPTPPLPQRPLSIPRSEQHRVHVNVVISGDAGLTLERLNGESLLIEEQDYVVTVRATGRRMPEAEARFTFQLDDGGLPVLRRVA